MYRWSTSITSSASSTRRVRDSDQHSIPTCAPLGIAAISRAELIELYEGQQLGLERIGQIYGVSRHTVTHLARRYGVALRQPGRPYRV